MKEKIRLSFDLGMFGILIAVLSGLIGFVIGSHLQDFIIWANQLFF